MKTDEKELRRHVTTLFERHGLCTGNAECVAEHIINAEIFGVKSHGLQLLPSHIKKLDDGSYNKHPLFEVEVETCAFSRINCDNSIGMVSADYCMKYAMKKCSDAGVFAVFAHHANTYGAAFSYPLLAAKQGLIGFTCANSPANMAPIGGKDKLLGTNPFSMVIPAKYEFPIIVDMATSKVAKSKFLSFKEKGEMLPEGWALDVNGKPTINPIEALKGSVCPMEGSKGYGIALMIDVVAGLLSTASYLDKVGHFYGSNSGMDIGQLFIAINPRIVYGDDFDSVVDDYIIKLRSSSRADNSVIPSIPGDRKRKSFQEVKVNGLEISDDIAALLEIY